MALIHHWDIAAVRDEMRRILTRDGLIILSEPICFSAINNRLRSVLPARENISDYEHPLTQRELATFTEHFNVEAMRYRLPLLPLLASFLHPNLFASSTNLFVSNRLWKMDRWILQHCRTAERYATNVTMRLRKTS